MKARYLALKDAYDEFWDHRRCGEDCTHPGIGDLVTFREVTDLIEGTPVEQPLTKDDMRALIDKLSPARFDAWLASCRSVLVDKLNAAGAKGTFFLTGTLYGCIYNQARAVKHAYEAGHQIASHTWYVFFLLHGLCAGKVADSP